MPQEDLCTREKSGLLWDDGKHTHAHTKRSSHARLFPAPSYFEQQVEFAQHALPFHIAQELTSMEGDGDARRKSILRAVLMADIHARQVGITSSGAAVALCLVEVGFELAVLECERIFGKLFRS